MKGKYESPRPERRRPQSVMEPEVTEQPKVRERRPNPMDTQPARRSAPAETPRERQPVRKNPMDEAPAPQRRRNPMDEAPAPQRRRNPMDTDAAPRKAPDTAPQRRRNPMDPDEPAPRRDPAELSAQRQDARKKKKKKKGNPFLHALAYIGTFLGMLVLTLFIIIKMICGGTSPSARQTYVTTMLETGQLKFMATWFMPAEEIQEIVNQNSMEKIDDTVDTDMITIRDFDDDEEQGEVKDVEVIEISGTSYSATLVKVRDPSRVKLATIYPWRTIGDTLDQLVDHNNALCGINGGIYNSTNNSGGMPYGVIVCNGEIQYNKSNELPGLVLIGFTEDNILQIIDINGQSPAQVETLIRNNKIRDAVTFQEENSDSNNHFVQLVINGNARGLQGKGSGLNPRTAIGQCADGSVLLLVTDGRGKNGHLGASASDLVDIMMKYGAVNAANLDGGSSSCMYYEGKYLRPSVTFYQDNSSWYLPAAFIVSK